MADARALEGRIALVTGASRGIGYEAALAIAREGAHVIALARTVGGLEELDDAIKDAGSSATLVPLDLTDYEALDRLGGTINDRWGKLDILVGNAGILGAVTPLSHLAPKTFDEVLAINVTANYRLIRSLEPLLLASDNGRALFLTALGAQGGRPFVAAYGASKAALDAMIQSWAAEHRKTALRANLLDPGPARTRMRKQVFPGEDASMVPDPSSVAQVIVDRLTSDDDTTGGTWSTLQGRWVTT